jgi:DNA polymerase III epsilon subunit-like protein
MFPLFDLSPGRKRKPHDGLADALCIALYGMSQMKGEQG